ncbi:MAG: glyoxalase, partial [Pseudomonadota bacterium]
LQCDGICLSNPFLSLSPEADARGGGVETRLYDIDRGVASAHSAEYGAAVLPAPEDQRHDLRESYIPCASSQICVASRSL